MMIRGDATGDLGAEVVGEALQASLTKDQRAIIEANGAALDEFVSYALNSDEPMRFAGRPA